MYQFLPYIVQGASMLMSAQAAKEAGKANRDAGAADLTSALVSGSFSAKGISERRDRVFSKMRARAGASGVELAGSPLEVLMHAAGQAERDLIISRLITEGNVNAAKGRIRGRAAQAQGAMGEAAFKIGQQYVTGYKGPTSTTGERFTDDELKIYGWD